MSRPDYVRCETCVYWEDLRGVEGEGEGCCREQAQEWSTTPGDFCSHWRSTWPVEYREISMTVNAKASISKLSEACSLLLRCSLPRDVSGRAMIDRARALIAEAEANGREVGDPERVEVPPPEVQQAKPVEAETELRPGLTYGGRGPGGEFYSKEVDDLASDSLWVREGTELRWTPEDLEAIAADMRARAKTPPPEELVNKPITVTPSGVVRLAREGDVERGVITEVDKGANIAWYTFDDEGVFAASLQGVLSAQGVQR